MLLSPVASSHALTISAQELASHPERVSERIAKAHAASGLPVDPNDKAWAIFDRNSRDFGSLPGLASVSVNGAEPGVVTLTFVDEGFRALADNVLQDAVEGVRLVLDLQEGAPSAPQWWSGSYLQMRNVVRAMPGVVDSQEFVEHGWKNLNFTVTDQGVDDRLRPLINEHLAGWAVTYLKAN